MNISIHRMRLQDVDKISPLLDRYRQFYARSADLEQAQRWLHHCCTNNKSVVFYAELDGKVAGFTQLFPMLSTVRCDNTWVLNDLFVEAFARRHGVGQALLKAAENFAKEDGAAYITLETTRDNLNAQALYHKAGWEAEKTQWFSIAFK
jgi:ribosomal protein S18 acetylase RimI-like enzyme